MSECPKCDNPYLVCFCKYRRIAENMKAMKDDKKDDKAPLDFLRLDAIEGACRVFKFGAEKYEKDNYLLGMEESRLTAAAMRHILQYQGGEFIDDESGFSHIDHALCCLMMLKSTQALGTSIKDIKEK